MSLHDSLWLARGLALTLLCGLHALHTARADAAIVLYPKIAVIGVWDFARTREQAADADVRTPARQAEIDDVVAQLARMSPTELHLARPAAEIEQAYLAWRRSERELAEDGIEQIGLRPAKAAGLEHIVGIGAPPMDLQAVVDWTAAQPPQRDIDWQRGIADDRAAGVLESLHGKRIRDTLRRINPARRPYSPVGIPARWLVQAGDADTRPGANALIARIDYALRQCARWSAQMRRMSSQHTVLVMTDMSIDEPLRWCLDFTPYHAPQLLDIYLDDAKPARRK